MKYHKNKLRPVRKTSIYKYNVKQSVRRTSIYKYNIIPNKALHLIKDKIKEAKFNREIILDAVRILKVASTKEILNYVLGQIELYNQTIKAQAEKKYEDEAFSNNDKRKYIEKESKVPIDIRTVQNWVKRLTKEGLLEYNSGKYSLTEKTKTEKARCFPELFGETLLDSICNFELRSQQENVQELVERYGAMLIFIFVEALSLTRDISSDTDIRSQINWIEDAIPISKMLEYFLNMIFKVKTGDYRFESMGLKSNEKTEGETMQDLKNSYPELYVLLEKAKESIQMD